MHEDEIISDFYDFVNKSNVVSPILRPDHIASGLRRVVCPLGEQGRQKSPGISSRARAARCRLFVLCHTNHTDDIINICHGTDTDIPARKFATYGFDDSDRGLVVVLTVFTNQVEMPLC